MPPQIDFREVGNPIYDGSGNIVNMPPTGGAMIFLMVLSFRNGTATDTMGE